MLVGFVYGFIVYFLVLIIGIVVLNSNKCINGNTVAIFLLSLIGHFVSTFIYSKLSSDSVNSYFLAANNFVVGSGTQFVQWMVWHIRKYLTGDSYLATLYLFSGFASVGSVLWYVVYLKICNLANVETCKKAMLPMSVLMCWPTSVFFTNAIGKDSLCYFFIPLTIITLANLFYKRKPFFGNLFVLTVALLWLISLRPYLLLIFLAAFLASSIKGIRSFKLKHLFTIVIFFSSFIFFSEKVVQHRTSLDNLSIGNVSEYVVTQQGYLDKGTSFPSLSKNPIINMPYGFVMNLAMPLFIFAGNIQGLLASFENFFLLYLIFHLWKRRSLFKEFRANNQYVRFCFFFFIMGMIFLALINTNLGLATRQKSMYLPALLVIMMIVRDLEYKQKLLAYENSNNSKRLTVST